MKHLLTTVILLIFISSCGSDCESLEDRISELETEKAELKEQLQSSSGESVWSHAGKKFLDKAIEDASNSNYQDLVRENERLRMKISELENR